MTTPTTSPHPPRAIGKASLQGTAEVVFIQPLGTPRQLGLAPFDPAQADDPIYLFLLEVRLPDQRPYHTRIGQRVPQRVESRLQEGMVVDVTVNPQSPRRVVTIDWASAP